MRKGPVFFHKTLTRQHIPAARLEPRVPVVRLCLGMAGELVEAAVASGAQGIVLEGNGAGNVPESAVPAILAALDKGVPIVLTSSAFQGMVDDIYGYPGGGHQLRQAGVIFGQGLSAAKARIKLMLALGSGYRHSQIQQLFEYLF